MHLLCDISDLAIPLKIEGNSQLIITPLGAVKRGAPTLALPFPHPCARALLTDCVLRAPKNLPRPSDRKPPRADYSKLP